MADTPFTTFAFPSADGSADRTMPDRLSDHINVKDYGALGNGTDNDTTALRDAFAAAFGDPGSPHGGGDARFTNREIYFPAGDYVVSSLPTMTISDMTDNGGEIRCVVNSTAGYYSAYMVEVYDVADALIDDASNGVWEITVDDGTHVTLKGSDSTNVAAYTTGASITANPLQMISVNGFRIRGSGNSSTRIFNTDGGVFVTNGSMYGAFSDMTVMAGGYEAGREICAIEINRYFGGTTAIQAMTFRNMSIGGSSTSCNIGLRIGRSGQQGSEITIDNCHFGSCVDAGLMCQNQNALLITMIGGQVQGCGKGIYAISGAIANIYFVSFQENDDFDIYQGSQGSPQDALNVIGCRSESANFVFNSLGAGTNIIGCGQTQLDAVFSACNGPVIIIGCSSEYGVVKTAGGGGTVYGFANYFPTGAADGSWLDMTTQLHAARAITAGFINTRDVPDSSGNLVNSTFATLHPAHLRIGGAEAVVYDSTTDTPDAIIAGGGSKIVKAVCKYDASGTPGWKWKVLYSLKA